MNDIREIVTKAIVGKGKKTIKIAGIIDDTVDIDSILGCWIINHQFEAQKVGNNVEILGAFELNVWYSLDGNSKTEVAKKEIEYEELIKIKSLVEDYIDINNDIIVRMLQQPVCTNAIIKEGNIHVDIVFEAIAEVIGETKMRVSVLNQYEEIDVEEMDIDEEINEDFLDERPFE